MTIQNDDFGRDPSVQRMRKLFSSMEKTQWDMLEKLRISSFDNRLRNIRKTALNLFEKAFPLAVSKGMNPDEKMSAMLYAFCLAHSFKPAGIDVPDHFLPDNKQLETVVMEILS
jgi:hypothetical protein